MIRLERLLKTRGSDSFGIDATALSLMKWDQDDVDYGGNLWLLLAS